jgi:hypothetical protein
MSICYEYEHRKFDIDFLPVSGRIFWQTFSKVWKQAMSVGRGSLENAEAPILKSGQC